MNLKFERLVIIYEDILSGFDLHNFLQKHNESSIINETPMYVGERIA